VLPSQSFGRNDEKNQYVRSELKAIGKQRVLESRGQRSAFTGRQPGEAKVGRGARRTGRRAAAVALRQPSSGRFAGSFLDAMRSLRLTVPGLRKVEGDSSTGGHPESIWPIARHARIGRRRPVAVAARGRFDFEIEHGAVLRVEARKRGRLVAVLVAVQRYVWCAIVQFVARNLRARKSHKPLFLAAFQLLASACSMLLRQAWRDKTDYESAALTIELRARVSESSIFGSWTREQPASESTSGEER
jgi:hypothetical protein